MARPKVGAWDFIEVGKEYQYKEDSSSAQCLYLKTTQQRKLIAIK